MNIFSNNQTEQIQPTQPLATPAETETKIEEEETRQVDEDAGEDRSAFNCPTCFGEGLQDIHTLCPQCNGTGKVS